MRVQTERRRVERRRLALVKPEGPTWEHWAKLTPEQRWELAVALFENQLNLSTLPHKLKG